LELAKLEIYFNRVIWVVVFGYNVTFCMDFARKHTE